MSKMDIYSQYISRQQHLSENSLISGQKLISEREVLINRLMAEGFTSKQIENLLTNYFQLDERRENKIQQFDDGTYLKPTKFGGTRMAAPIRSAEVDSDLWHYNLSPGEATPDEYIAGKTPGGGVKSATDIEKALAPKPAQASSASRPTPAGSAGNVSAARKTPDAEAQEGGFYGKSSTPAQKSSSQSTDAEAQEGGFYGKSSTPAQKSSSQSTDAEAQEGGFYGKSPKSTATPAKASARPTARPAKASARPTQPGSKQSSLGSKLGNIGYKVRATSDTAAGRAKIKLLDQAAEDRAKARAKTTGRPAWAKEIRGFENY